MAGVEVRDFDSPDETRKPDKTMIEVIRMSGATAARMRLEPRMEMVRVHQADRRGREVSGTSSRPVAVGHDARRPR